MENNKGAPISISRDIESDEDWINIKSGKETIIKVKTSLWDDRSEFGFTAEIRDQIVTTIRKLYG